LKIHRGIISARRLSTHAEGKFEYLVFNQSSRPGIF
jgi:hypothetical protein